MFVLKFISRHTNSPRQAGLNRFVNNIAAPRKLEIAFGSLRGGRSK